jgi:predicted chitinase
LDNAKTNIGHLKNAALQVGLRSKYAIASLIGVAGGESKWVPQEVAYKYSISRIRQIFPNLTDEQYNRSTRSNITRKEFFEIVYGEYAPQRVGNRNVADGGLYYGRGYIQLTGYIIQPRHSK